MIKVKKGSGEYRKIISVSAKREDIHSPGSWRQKLEDNSSNSNLFTKQELNKTFYLTFIGFVMGRKMHF